MLLDRRSGTPGATGSGSSRKRGGSEIPLVKRAKLALADEQAPLDLTERAAKMLALDTPTRWCGEQIDLGQKLLRAAIMAKL